jgi:hypothetical protein
MSIPIHGSRGPWGGDFAAPEGADANPSSPGRGS